MYPETIEKAIIDSREHPEMAILELFQGKYRIYNSFWDGVKYQSHSVGARYGYKNITIAKKTFDAHVAKCREQRAYVEACQRENAERMAALARQSKPRIRLMPTVREVTA
jgi:hypothetical protein